MIPFLRAVVMGLMILFLALPILSWRVFFCLVCSFALGFFVANGWFAKKIYVHPTIIVMGGGAGDTRMTPIVFGDNKPQEPEGK